MSTPLLDDFNGPFRMARMRLPIGRWAMGKKVARVQPPLNLKGGNTDRTPLAAASTPSGELMLRVSPALAKELGWKDDGIVFFKIEGSEDNPSEPRALVIEVR